MLDERIIPRRGLQLTTGGGVEAENKMLDFLHGLPDDYFLLREVRTLPSLERRQAGGNEDRIDLVVVGPKTGIIIFEVKDWNIRRNVYEWVNQYIIRKIDEQGHETELRNPQAQVDEYFRAVRQLLLTQSLSTVNIYHFLVFPKITRAEFENRLVPRNGSTKNPQEKFNIDLEHTLFRDDLDQHRHEPLQLLMKHCRPAPLAAYTEEMVLKVVGTLIPAKMRVGTTDKDAQKTKTLLILNPKQQEWAFSNDTMASNYMLDVAGSGKTNILLSRAIHLVNCNSDATDFRVLILTYSVALAKDLHRMLKSKCQEDDAVIHSNKIAILDISTLMEELVNRGLGLAEAERWRLKVKQEMQSDEDYLEYRLPEKCQDILYEQPDRFRWYDYLLVDEVQDFSSIFLDVGISLLKQREHIFMVGDVGQKLFPREPNLSELGIVEQRVRIPPTHHMYRSPQHIARLAWSFLLNDSLLNYELREQGYKSVIAPKNTSTIKPVFKECSTKEEMLEEVCDDICDDIVKRMQPGNILCIGLPETLMILKNKLQEHNVPSCQASEISDGEKRLVLAEFIMAKGLERDYVYILDSDHLPDGSIDKNHLFISDEELAQEARKSRIKIFVALTRALREVYIYYTLRSRFIQELLMLQRNK